MQDVAVFEGLRPQMVIGYGLVTGLKGTGDREITYFTRQALMHKLKELGQEKLIDPEKLTTDRVAAVLITAEIPPLAEAGDRVDVLVSSLGDATSLVGGTLMVCGLAGVDEKIYVEAEGRLSINDPTPESPTVGQVIRGGRVTQPVQPIPWRNREFMNLKLKRADFGLAAGAAEAINAKFPEASAQPLDATTVRFRMPKKYRDDIRDMLMIIRSLEVKPTPGPAEASPLI